MDAVEATTPQAITNRLSMGKGRVPWTIGGTLRILIVDSQWTAAEQLAETLRGQGHKLRCARRGAEALVVAEELEPHLVLIETSGASDCGCPTSVLLRCRPWAEHLVLIGHARSCPAEAPHRELLHYEFPGAIDVEQLMPIYENVLRMRGVGCLTPV